MRRALPLLAALCLAFAPVPFPNKRQHPADVGGTWELLSWEDRAVRRVGAEKQYRVEMTRLTAAIVATGGPYREDYVMGLDPRASPPAFTWSSGGRLTFVGSYRLRGDQMTVIFDRAERRGGERPTDFAGSPDFRFVMRRVRR